MTAIVPHSSLLIAQLSTTASPTQQTITDPESELRAGIDLSRAGKLEQAIPHLKAAAGHVKDEYAAEFNLALCYVGTGQLDAAVSVLNGLRASGHNTAAMNNLLAQAYVGEKNPRAALDALRAAAAQTPKDEKLYAHVADACTDYKEYDLGLQVVNLGLTELPQSSRLHYERAMFLAQMDRYEEAKPEFDQAAKLQPESDVAYLAMVQEALYEDRFADAERFARAGIASGHGDYVLLSLLGTVLLHAGAVPGQPEFAEARKSLEAAVAERPDYSTAQIALGNLYLMVGKLNDAVTHLEVGRRLEPRNASVYSHLANAYQRLGEKQKAREMLAILGQLVQK
ncbi:tetratricopeptide repeat protein [Alloacidobacterium sp.]|uniref:tetratricopeptide repeat protein n=1 Tax=Alloacidobacterium sp. TaxID=2951999 RepID=UPI002D43523A|nr:tetratricopeptide repeat protein [Alloacidobacterium sp.]HYK35756.1 tetratricopeptide repeat protein [Alloacidobacterium sp.]